MRKFLRCTRYRARSGHLGLMRTGCRKIRSAACPVLPGVAAVMPTSIPELSSSSLRSEGGQGASPVALSVGDDTREAWSCPPPNEIFTVGSQGRDEEIAGVGVAIALHRLLAPTPARHASQPLYASRRIDSLRCSLRRDGSLPSSMRRSCPSQGSEHLLFRSHSSTWITSCLRRG